MLAHLLRGLSPHLAADSSSKHRADWELTEYAAGTVGKEYRAIKVSLAIARVSGCGRRLKTDARSVARDVSANCSRLWREARDDELMRNWLVNAESCQ